jgi:phenylalanyl-tRNA synthetase beta chain
LAASEAAKAAAQRAVDLLVLVAGGTAEAGVTDVLAPHPVHSITIAADHPDHVAGQEYGRETVVRRLQEVGCTVVGTDVLVVTPPTWRPDLTDPNDLAEEVIRLEGYENLPSTLPQVPAGRGLTEPQRLRRRIGLALAAAGYVEVQNYPFIGEAVLDGLGIEAGDPRRDTVQLANPISHEEPSLRTTLLPGLLGALHRNVGRGTPDIALYELGRVFRVDGTAETLYHAPRLPVDRRPTEDEIAQLDAALPRQPYRVGVVLAGHREPQGWWDQAETWTWADAIEAARTVAAAAQVELTARQDQHAPWHPGRCAALYVADQLVGHAGELHPRTVKALHLPERTCAMELDLDLLTEGGANKPEGPKIPTFPVATQDVALIVDGDVPAAEVESALRAGAGELLESLRLFDVYRGESIGAGKKSLAYALRFRAADRTLTADEATAARESAVAEATRRIGATLRG